MHRRTVLKGVVSGIGLAAFHASRPLQASDGQYSGPILDAHIHQFDPRRPQGIPWPEKNDSIYAPALAPEYFRNAAPLGVQSAIAVEASPWIDDNFWLLDTVKSDKRMAGFVGNLPLGEKGFAQSYTRLEAEPLFLGSRYGNLWDRDLGNALQTPAFIADLKTLSQNKRTLDSANPDPRLIKNLLLLSDRVPELPIMIDHLPNANVPRADRQAYISDLTELSKRPTVFMKLSEIPRLEPSAKNARFDISVYREGLDALWSLFGENKVVFGSDWPNSEHLGSLEQTIGLAKSFLQNQSLAAQKKVFADNARHFYGLSQRVF
jgi:L-fuconolactonase